MDAYFHRNEINSILSEAKRIARLNDRAIDGVLEKIRKRIRLTDLDVGVLLYAPSKFSDVIFAAASELNEYVFKKNIEFYGVVYLSDYCIETCAYCGDGILSLRQGCASRKEKMTLDETKTDIEALLKKWPSLNQICLLSGDSPSLNADSWIRYLSVVFELFNGKVILNKEPLNIIDFKKVRNAFPNKMLQFRVFQETYDSDIYEREHKFYGEVLQENGVEELFLRKHGIVYPPKTDYYQRLFSQERSIVAGFDEYGLGVLLGLNDGEHKSFFEALSIKRHSDFLFAKFGLWPATISFPRILPSQGVEYKLPGLVDDETYIRLLSVTKLAIPNSKIINTCRETAEMRSFIRPVINIEDFEARPGPGGNSSDNVIGQMEITDTRSGYIIADEIISQGYSLK